jgi:apolipoprotein N-acyltransferase
MDNGAVQEAVPQAAPRLISRLKTGDAWVNIFLAVLSGVLAGLAFPPFELWPLAWVALVPLLIALRRTTALRFAGYLALLFGMSLCAVSLFWMTAIFHGPLAIGVFFLASLPWLLFGLAYRVLCDRSPAWVVLALAPALWLAVEWIRCEGWYFRFSWLQLGFTIVPHDYLRANLYPLIGVYGVTLLIVLVNVALALLLTRRDWRPPVAAFGAVILVLLVATFNMKYTTAVWPKSDDGMIVQNESGTLDDLLRSTRAEMQPETRLVVWPEYALPVYLLEDGFAQHDLQEIQAFTREHNCTLVVGTKKHAPDDAPCDWLRRRGMIAEGGLFYNIALVIGPDGQVLGDYAKTHPIQFFSDGVPGQSYQPIETPAGRLGIAICYDFDYAHTALNLVHNGAEVLVVPTFDELSWGESQHRQHTRIAQARVAEVGRWTMRATSSGISQVLDPTGRPLASIPFGESAAASADFIPLTTRTPYVRFMWLLPYFCLGISLLWALSLISKRLFRSAAARRRFH